MSNISVILESGERVPLAPGDRINFGTGKGMIVFFEEEEAALLRRLYEKRERKTRSLIDLVRGRQTP